MIIRCSACRMKGAPHLLVLLLAAGWLGQVARAQTYALDRQSTCNQYLTVYDTDLTLTARSNVAPANPPLECIVYLQSAYELADGRYRLQIIVEQMQIRDCSVKLSLFNGYGATGNYLRELGCSSSSTDIIYSTGRQVTVRFSRPQDLYQTAYAVTLTIRTYADGDDLQTAVGVDKLPTGALIGIGLGVVVVLALAILLCWCCCTGYLYEFMGLGAWDGGRSSNRSGVAYTAGSVDSNLEKGSTTSSTMQLKNGINYEDPAVWSSLTGLNSDSNKNFRPGVPRKSAARGDSSRETDRAVEMRPRAERETYGGRSYENAGGQNYENSGAPGRDSHAYEPYDVEVGADRSPRFRKRQDEQRGSGRSRGSRGSRRSRNSATEEGVGVQGATKETVIDDPATATTDDEDLKKPLDEGDEEVARLQRFASEPDVDTIASQTHVNAGVRASIPDLTGEPSPSPSPRAKKRSSTSPKSRRRPKGPAGGDPDPLALPPEAFDPVFTTPTSQEQYPGEFRPAGQPFLPAVPFAPYGVWPMVPGQQTYAYAYQTAPQPGAPPGSQGAYFLQSVPTADGDVRNTALVMQSTRTPQRKGSKDKGGVGGHPGPPDFSSTPGGPRPPDMSVIAAGAAPPDPGAGHRSVAMKSFADPDSGLQTTQVLWTDNVPDPTDPGPGDSSQITRKTTTRVTTRCGQGDLPAQTASLLDYQDPNPAFLAPSTPQHAQLHPAAITPNTTNVDYYLGGQGSAPVRPPDVVHEAPSRNRAIRDRVTLGDSTA